jgi:hypothetical protein
VAITVPPRELAGELSERRAISAPDLKTAIEALLDGKPIRPAETKAFGCAIPRRQPGESGRRVQSGWGSGDG